MSERHPLTEPQSRLFEFLRAEVRSGRGVPSQPRMQAAMGWKSVRNVTYHLEALEAKGYVVLKGGQRGIEIIGEGSGLALPYAGEVAASGPMPAADPQERFSFNEAFGGDDNFVMKVRGDSMIEAHIADGDYVVLRKSPEAIDGEKVVCMIDGGVTLKVFRRTRGVVWLHPCNVAMKPIRLDPADSNTIVGVLVGVVRREKRGKK